MEITKVKNKTYLYRKGVSQGNCHLSRTELVPIKQGEHYYYLMSLGGNTESCIGENCSYCLFHPSENKCLCSDEGKTCSYSVRKNHEIMGKY